MNIIFKKIDEIKPYAKNPRKIPAKAVDVVAKSIKQFGFKNPIIVDDDGVIVCGHTRLLAAKQLSLAEVPVIKADDLSAKQIKAFRLVDNKTSELSEWDIDVLQEELNFDFGFDITDFGFEIEESTVDSELVDNVPDIDACQSIVKSGDIWQLGNHRLMCGDCTLVADVSALLCDTLVDCLITDPPYGVDYASKNEMLNKLCEGNRIQIAIKNDNIKDYRAFFASFLGIIPFAEYNTFYIAMSGQELHNLRLAIEDSNLRWCDYLIWAKNNHVLGRKDYNAKHEFFAYGWKNKHKFYGDFSTTILEFNKPLKNDLHPTMKPVALLEKLVKDGSAKNANIYDPFGGSGSTLIACEAAKRNCFMMEVDEHYCDVIIKRWEDLTGNKAVKMGNCNE